jgi:hypothetical protein
MATFHPGQSRNLASIWNQFRTIAAFLYAGTNQPGMTTCKVKRLQTLAESAQPAAGSKKIDYFRSTRFVLTAGGEALRDSQEGRRSEGVMARRAIRRARQHKTAAAARTPSSRLLSF